jgi:hypothetical protein
MANDWPTAEVVLEQNGRVVAVYKLGRNSLGQWVMLDRVRPNRNQRPRSAPPPTSENDGENAGENAGGSDGDRRDPTA